MTCANENEERPVAEGMAEQAYCNLIMTVPADIFPLSAVGTVPVLLDSGSN
jgi:hypothetical protein